MIQPSLRRRRDARLDVLRGLALAMIFVDHLPGNPYEHFTLRSLGFSDAAEGFVLMAGTAAALAYGPAFRPGATALVGTLRLWERAWTLYLVNIYVTVLAFAVAAGLALWAHAPALLRMSGIDMLFLHPLQILVAVPLLTFQLHYVDILPLYSALMLAAPAILWLGWRWPGWLLTGSLLVWGVSGELRLLPPSWPGPDGWAFSPTSWQVLFVVGVLMGIGMREGRRLVPARGWLLAACLLFLALALIDRHVWPVRAVVNAGLDTMADAGVPWTLIAFDKTWETAPRLLHVLALAYVLSVMPWVRNACESRWAAPLALLGRHSLPVFALGTVLAFLLRGLRAEEHWGPLQDALALGAGLLLQWGLAWSRDQGKGLVVG